MTSQRNALLDAVQECVMDVGFRRTTLADVARRAGVSRMTLYRQEADLDTLVSGLLTRELVAVVDAARKEVAQLPTARERLVEAGVRTIERIDHHPLYRRVLDLDPELLLPLIVDRFGSTQQAALELVTEQLEEGQRDGSIRDVDSATAAKVLLLTAQSFVFSARLVEDAAYDELRRMLDGYLR
jgi:AcrR family transcriptional regulator